MSHFIVFLTLLIISCTATAMPKVGDEATYNTTSESNGISTPMGIDVQLINFDSSTNEFTQRSIFTYSGTTQTRDDHVSSEYLLSDNQVSKILSTCVQGGGLLENVTVPAGTFATCAIPQTGEGILTAMIWVGAVSFGIVKQEFTTTNGNHSTVELASQKLGQ